MPESLSPEMLDTIASVVEEKVKMVIDPEAIETMKTEIAELIEAKTDMANGMEEFANKGMVENEELEKYKKEVSTMVEDEVQKHLKTKFAKDNEIKLSDRQEKMIWKERPSLSTPNMKTNQITIDTCHKDRSAPFTKETTLSVETVGGADVQVLDPWAELVNGDSFRNVVTVLPVSGGSFVLPEMTNATISKRTTNRTFPNVAADVPAGDVTDRTVNINDWDGAVPLSNAQDQDVPGLRALYATRMFQSYARAIGIEFVSKLKVEAIKTGNAITLSGTVPSGVATGIPTAANIAERLNDLVTNLPTQYRAGATYHVSRQVFGRLMTGLQQSEGLALLPGTTIPIYFGYSVYTDDNLEPGGTANDLQAVFGNFSVGGIYGERSGFSAEENPYAMVGGVVIYGLGRAGVSVWDPKAITAMVSRAS